MKKEPQRSIMGTTYYQNDNKEKQPETFCAGQKQEILPSLSVKLQKWKRKKRLNLAHESSCFSEREKK